MYEPVPIHTTGSTGGVAAGGADGADAAGPPTPTPSREEEGADRSN